MADDIYCFSCGKKIKELAEICPNCGVRQKQKAATHTKSKTAAFLLAVFFSHWTWCYTYKFDAWKFWLGLILSITGIALYFIPTIFVWLWAMIDSLSKDDKWYETYYKE